jgi:hypothetical protein
MRLGLTGPRNAEVSQSEKKKREKGGRLSLSTFSSLLHLKE